MLRIVVHLRNAHRFVIDKPDRTAGHNDDIGGLQRAMHERCPQQPGCHPAKLLPQRHKRRPLPPVAHACEKIAEKHPLRPLCQYHIDIMKALRRIEQQHLPTPEQIFGEVRRTHLLQVSGPLPRLHIPAFIIFQRKSQLIRAAVPPHPENGNRAAAVQAVMRLPVFTFKVNPFQRFEASLGIGEGFEQLID